MKLKDIIRSRYNIGDVVEALKAQGYTITPPCRQTRVIKKMINQCALISRDPENLVHDTPKATATKLHARAKEIADTAWEGMLRVIHSMLGVESGDQAAYFFSDNDVELVREYMTSYVMSEITLFFPEAAKIKESSPKVNSLITAEYIDEVDKACHELFPPKWLGGARKGDS